ncbi:MAG TPA: NRDE family protein, partial [Casimicrobiaceae bacterium]|nr:NRDE family protein [Casimicrobiaceae bacterium]
IARDGAKYHGFNLLVGEIAARPHPSARKRREMPEPPPDDRSTAAYASNRASGAIALPAGIHGLSNHLLDTPWPKLVRIKERLSDALDGQALDSAAVFALLADRELSDDTALPMTGVSREWERMLSSAFIVSPEYGTRCSTVFTLARDGSANFVERSFDAAGNMTGETAHVFTVAVPAYQHA